MTAYDVNSEGVGDFGNRRSIGWATLLLLVGGCVVNLPSNDGVRSEGLSVCADKSADKFMSGGCCGPLTTDSLISFPSSDGVCHAPYEEIGFLDPVKNPLSTFSLDVCTTSYTWMRRCLNQSEQLPLYRFVRIEEYVNYFTYDYSSPEGDEPLAVDCELAACPWNAAHQLLRIGVRGKPIEHEAMPPCNLAFLIDVSGSMSGGDRIDLVKRALGMLVRQLRDEDHVAVVTYADEAFVPLPSVSGSEKKLIMSVIDGLRAGGGTSGGDGIRRAYAEAEKNFDPEANNRVILVTDGDLHIGIRAPGGLTGLISDKRGNGIFFSVLGVGSGNLNDVAMKELVKTGNGNYAYLDSFAEAEKALRDEFGGALVTVAKDVKVQIEFDSSAVKGYRPLGYENRLLAAENFEDREGGADEIDAGRSVTAFYELDSTGTGVLFTVKTRYKLPGSGTDVVRERTYAAAELTRSEPSAEFRFASAVAEFALLLRDSKYRGEASFANLIERARNAKGEDRDGLRAEFIGLAEKAGDLNAARFRVPQAIGCRHVDGGSGESALAVWEALCELKTSQADDGSWGTNKLAETAWTILACLSNGDLPGNNRNCHVGLALANGVSFLIDAAETASDRDVALLAWTFVWLYDCSRNPDAYEAAVGLFRRMKAMKPTDPGDMLLRTEACRWAQLSMRDRAGCDLAVLADELMPALAGWWSRFDAQGDDIAYKCRALTLSEGELTAESYGLLDGMRKWSVDDARPLASSLAAAVCKYAAGVQAHARPEDVASWKEWDRTANRSLSLRLKGSGDVRERALIILHLTVSRRYWRMVLQPSTPGRSSSVHVDVDI